MKAQDLLTMFIKINADIAAEKGLFQPAPFCDADSQDYYAAQIENMEIAEGAEADALAAEVIALAAAQGIKQ